MASRGGEGYHEAALIPLSLDSNRLAVAVDACTVISL